MHLHNLHDWSLFLNLITPAEIGVFSFLVGQPQRLFSIYHFVLFIITKLGDILVVSSLLILWLLARRMLVQIYMSSVQKGIRMPIWSLLITEV